MFVTVCKVLRNSTIPIVKKEVLVNFEVKLLINELITN